MKNEVRKAYKILFNELAKPKYATWTMYDYFVKGKKYKNKINVTLRIDVDFTLKGCLQLGKILKSRKISASFFFLTFPRRYYNIWKSKVPELLAKMGFEIGLHTDHYYEQIISSKNGIELLKEDIKRLSKLSKTKIYGMVAHGHPEINKMKKANSELYKDLPPEYLSLAYHDGMYSKYTKNFLTEWLPNTDYYISDFMGIIGCWNYCPYFAIQILKKMKPGESIHIVIHPTNVFFYSKYFVKSYSNLIKALYLCYVKENFRNSLKKIFGARRFYKIVNVVRLIKFIFL